MEGLLIDSANHFLPLENLLTTIDAMAYNKMNVFHWHLTDSYSFPFVSKTHPSLVKGAWNATNAAYTASDMNEIANAALLRGVRIVLEVDMPGHAYAWGIGIPGITVQCPNFDCDVGPINAVPFDPSNDQTYEVIDDVVRELARLLPSEHLHLGGDEIKYGCWNTSKPLLSWMKHNGLEDFRQVVDYFYDKVMKKTVGPLRRRVVTWGRSISLRRWKA